jgi:putative transposase
MTRPIQFSIDEYYHVYNRGNDKRTIFLDSGDYIRFLSLLYISNNARTIHRSDYLNASITDILSLPRGDTLVDIGAYCLMSNHIHLLLREKKENGISIFMQKLLTGYTMYFNKKHKKSGSLFQGVFKAVHVNTDEYLKYLFSYIHLNPVRLIDPEWKEKGIADLQKTKEYLQKYPYSSYRDFQDRERPTRAILNITAFPDYFETTHDFEECINDWLTYQSDFSIEPPSKLSRRNLDNSNGEDSGIVKVSP